MMTPHEAIARDWYCTVGHQVYLESLPEGSPDQFPLQLLLCTRKGVVGSLYAAIGKDRIELSIETIPSLASALKLEGLRLFSRIAMRIGRNELPLYLLFAPEIPAEEALLASDGFERTAAGAYTRKPGKFVRPPEDKAQSMDGVYMDPFSIPWNFVPVEKDLLRHFFESAQEGRPLHILDLGCGYGKNARFLNRFGFEVHGIDIAAAAINRCKDLMPGSGNFRAASATDLPWPDDSFDVVLDIGCLHCLPAELRAPAQAEVARVLKPGGYMLSRLFKQKGAQWLLDQPFETQEFGFSRLQLEEMFRQRFALNILEENDWAFYTRAEPLTK